MVIGDLTSEEISTLRFLVEWYDRNWVIDGIRTRSAELYDDGFVSYERFHQMAEAFGTAYASRNQNLSEPIGRGPVLNLSDDDIFIATVPEGFRVFAGKVVGYLLWCTICEAAHVEWRPRHGTNLNPLVERLKAAIKSVF